ncbi:MAG: undecaprenyl-diphosphate phosphatase [Bacteroides sp.]|nr:undecaprenyl-diphosphate phosphatase [Bacteroides sp.]MCM1379335.1 undecaprenyl-diphosphate phosphatase [Bacteroides sp.]MCM1445006.1 undecaprenyl-diphosphate phosphatase [Prevotella sp.]
MTWIDTLILGITQGLTEYLPVSSSGHLEIFRQILGQDLEGGMALEFDLMLHVATVLSTIVVLWHEFWSLLKSFVTFKRDDNFYYVCKILVSCIPVAIVGFTLEPIIEKAFEGNLTIVGICLLVTAALLCFAYFTRTREALKHPDSPQGRDISWLDAFIIGCGQAVAVLPGLSRSGTTIATGILLGDNREKVARFSFFMVIIPILGKGLLDLKDILFSMDSSAPTAVVSPGAMIVGFLAAFIVGCLACKWMLNIVKQGKLVWFAVYCAIVGIICLVW